MKRSDLRVLPCGYDCGDYLYAAEFSDGVVKVGCSRNLRTRAEALYDRARREGRTMVSFFSMATGRRDVFGNERAALAVCRQSAQPISGRREWFDRLPFHAAVCAIESVVAA